MQERVNLNDLPPDYRKQLEARLTEEEFGKWRTINERMTAWLRTNFDPTREGLENLKTELASIIKKVNRKWTCQTAEVAPEVPDAIVTKIVWQYNRAPCYLLFPKPGMETHTPIIIPPGVVDFERRG
jgi:hypothetical protein